MSSKRQSENSPEHHEISSLIPWYVNDTLDDHERQRVDVHVAACAVCREDLAVHNRIFEGMEAQPALDYMPAASLKRLQARLDDAQAQSGSPQAPSTDPIRQTPWRGWMAASIGALALAIGVLAADRWVQFDSPASRGSDSRCLFADDYFGRAAASTRRGATEDRVRTDRSGCVLFGIQFESRGAFVAGAATPALHGSLRRRYPTGD
jgi:hypothetical protein